jgi:hypothetical protein
MPRRASPFCSTAKPERSAAAAFDGEPTPLACGSEVRSAPVKLARVTLENDSERRGIAVAMLLPHLAGTKAAGLGGKSGTESWVLGLGSPLC